MSTKDMLTVQESIFIQAIMFEGKNAAEAYRAAYPDKVIKKTSIHEQASRLKNSAKVKAAIRELTMSNMNRIVCTREEHVSELAKIRDLAIENKHYAAALNAEVSRGKVAGHYIDRKEITHKSGDDLQKLIELASSNKVLALTYADELGLTDDLNAVLNKDQVWGVD